MERGALFALFDLFVDSIPPEIRAERLRILLERPYVTHDRLAITKLMLCNIPNFSFSRQPNPLFLEFAEAKLAELASRPIVHADVDY